ncbi:MAG: ATP/GTP-binding protein [Candidatus Nitrosoabyssus spongiisocia]|nr:MAG: ATP/GTP-binding protein [Nitrosopumilaceae archaeon AB1(1)]
MKSIFVTGTAGAGKSLFTSRLHEYYTKNGTFAVILNLNPGVESTPYTCDVDVRDYVDLIQIMKQYDLGPNGSLIMASDLIASKIEDIKKEVFDVNPDYLIIDTPGQIELFAYRTSGSFIAQSLIDQEVVSVFIYDGVLVTTPVNFVSIALLATSIKLRLGLPTLNVMTKTDIIGTKLKDILKWSTSMSALENELSITTDGETFALVSNILRSMNQGGFAQGLLPVSNATSEGMVTVQSMLSRILDMGEEIED